LIITPISWLDFKQRKSKILQLRGVEEKLAQSKADLQFLRMQINPHFLFNALNTLYGTALIEGSKNTAEGIQKLGDMMRFMLHENTLDYIGMDKEIQYLKNYISLQKLRTQTSPDIVIEETIPNEGCDNRIAPMLLIPFVENAFKHGVSLTERSWIKIKLECDDQNINFEVLNSTHLSTGHDPERGQSGIGLQNVKERLLLLYPGKHQFTYGAEGCEFVARLSVNVN
jgi:two-component system, LytTR family, sensor kinase